MTLPAILGELPRIPVMASPLFIIANPSMVVARTQCRKMIWRPIRLGVTVIKLMGLRPVQETPLKAEYVRADLRRLTTLVGMPLQTRTVVSDVLRAPHLFYRAGAAPNAGVAKTLLRARWVDGVDISAPPNWSGSRTSLDSIRLALAPFRGCPKRRRPCLARGAFGGPPQDAIAKGLVGSPACVVADPAFWGVDHLWMLKQFLAAGDRYQSCFRSKPAPLLRLDGLSSLTWKTTHVHALQQRLLHLQSESPPLPRGKGRRMDRYPG